MAVFRVERNKGYTVMSNHHLRNKELSLKAKGLLSQMLSLPEDWDYTLKGLCRSCCVNSCFFLVINPSVQYETKWVSERSVWMLRSDALLRYSFFYSGDNDYRNSSVSFCNAAPLLISDFFSAPLAKQKETWYNMTERTESVIFKEARAWLLPITRPSSSARHC